MNQAYVSGYLGQDPKLSADGKRISMSVGVSKYMGKDKEKRTMWFRILVEGDYNLKLAESARKGDRVIASGLLESREWEDQQAMKRTIVEIVINQYDGEIVVIPKSDRQEQPHYVSSAPTYTPQAMPAQQYAPLPAAAPVFVDDIPF